MDQSYLEWLAGLPFLDEAKARALADRFPTFEHLRAASRGELLSVAGGRPEDGEALHGWVHAEADGATKGAELFLCPACGSFAGSSATVCPVCGASFVEAASEPPSPAPTPQAPPSAPTSNGLRGCPASARTRRCESSCGSRRSSTFGQLRPKNCGPSKGSRTTTLPPFVRSSGTRRGGTPPVVSSSVPNAVPSSAPSRVRVRCAAHRSRRRGSRDPSGPHPRRSWPTACPSCACTAARSCRQSRRAVAWAGVARVRGGR